MPYIQWMEDILKKASWVQERDRDIIVNKSNNSSDTYEYYVNCGHTNEMKMWSSQLWLQFKQLQRKPKKCFQKQFWCQHWYPKQYDQLWLATDTLADHTFEQTIVREDQGSISPLICFHYRYFLFQLCFLFQPFEFAWMQWILDMWNCLRTFAHCLHLRLTAIILMHQSV